MGQMTMHAMTRRVVAILNHSQELALKTLEGKRFTFVQVKAREGFGEAVLILTLRDDEGTEFSLAAGTIATFTDDGALGYNIEEMYDLDDLKQMIRDTIKDPGHLSTEDLSALRSALNEITEMEEGQR